MSIDITVRTDKALDTQAGGKVTVAINGDEAVYRVVSEERECLDPFHMRFTYKLRKVE